MERLLGVPMAVVVGVVVGLFVLGVVSLLATALRNRLLLALALRNIPRRRMQSALICIGLALGTVIVSTALNTGDTMSHTVRSLVAGTVGRADEVIVQPRRDARRSGFDGVQSVADGTFLTGTLSYFGQAEYDRLAGELAGEERIAGLAPAIVEQVVALNLSTQELQAQVRLYALPRDYPTVLGRLESYDGRPIALADGAVLNLEAAAALKAEPGQTLRLYYRERPLELRVADVAKSGELTGTQAAILVPLADFQAATEQVGSINQILVANRGDAATSVRLSEEVAASIRPLLVDEAAAERLHSLLSSDIGRAELGAALANLEGRNRERVEALLRELDADRPTASFKALVSDPELERRLFGVGARLAALQGRPGTNLLSTSATLRVVETKRLSQELADRWGGALTSVFVVLGLFSIATGIMLVILIFVLLAAERRSELGVTRAIGAKRRHLALMFLYEGLAYDLIASTLGLALGVGIAMLLVRVSADMLAGFGIALSTRLEPLSLVLAFCLGGVLTMVSIAFAAWRASRVTVVAAIRNLPEPPREGRGVRSVVSGPLLAVLGVAVGGLGAARGWALPMGIGVALATIGVVLAIRPLLGALRLSRAQRDRLAFSIGGLGLLLYWLLPEEVLRSGGLRPLPRSMDVFFLAGLCLVLGAVWLLVFNLDLLVAIVRRLWAPSRSATLVARVAFSYPVAERFRTGMAVAMFALVIFSMVVASVLLTGTHRAYSDPAVMAGGFDVRVDQTVGGAPDLRDVLPGVETIKADDLAAVAVQQSPPAEAIQPGAGAQSWRTIGLHLVDDRFLTAVRTGFTARAEGYGSDEAIWQALRESPGLAVIAGPAVRPRGAEPRGSAFRIDGVAQEDTKLRPTPLWVRDTRGGRAVKLTVIGVLDPRASFGTGLFTSASSFAESGAPVAGRTVYMLKLADGANPAEVALALNLSLNARGLRAGEIGEEVRRIQGVRMLLNDLLQGFIGVGLLAGIAGLGVISTRAVVERRQQIGVMRALGFTRRTVQLSFLLEASFVAALGIVVGVALGLGLSYRLVEFLGREFPEIIFSIPWGQIALLSASAYGAALLTTFLPAYQAGRVNPAQALRYE
jgi:putative ABC transport system permease protein